MITFTGKNRVSSDSVSIPIAVTKGPCFKPILVLKDNNPCEPNCLNGEKVGFHQLLQFDWVIY